MKINPVSGVVGQYAKLKAYSAKESPVQSMGTDQLELSDQARLFTEALSAAKRNAEISSANQQEKLERLKTLIAEDSYTVDTDQLCEKLLLG